MVSTIIVSLLSASTLAVVTSAVTAWQRSIEKKLDWEREDKKEAEKERKADDVARKLLVANERVSRDTNEVKGQLRQIHTLVNSNLTASMKSDLDSKVRMLAMMKQIVARDEAEKVASLPEALSAITVTESEIAELKAALDDRLRQTELADLQLRQAG